MGEEPRGSRCVLVSACDTVYPDRVLTRNIGLPIQSGQIGLVSISHANIRRRRWSLILAIIRPSHPVQTALDSIEIALPRVEVGRKEDLLSCSCGHGLDVYPVARKRRHKDLAVDLELAGVIRILPDFGAYGAGLADIPPGEVKREKDLYPVLCGRFVCETQLGIGVGVCSNVQGKGIYAEGFGAFHVVVVVGCALADAGEANLDFSVSIFALLSDNAGMVRGLVWRLP